MSTTDGENANATTFNAGYLSRKSDSDTVGVVGLNNTTDPNSGTAIVNTQRLINEVADSDGTAGEGDATRKTYSSTNYVANGDDRKVAIGKLDTQVKTNADGVATNAASISGLDADDIAESATRYWSKKNNLEATTNPTATDDSASNYSIGSLWYNRNFSQLFVCEDATATAAVWAANTQKNNLTASSDPAAGDDSADGYVNGSFWYNTTNDTLFICEDNTATAAVWQSIAGGGGGADTRALDIFFQEDYETNAPASLSSGNSADFGDSGTLQGTLANETVSPLAGTRSAKFTQAAGSLNDWIKFNDSAITLDTKQINQTVTVRFYGEYDGNAADLLFVAEDQLGTNLTESTDYIINQSMYHEFTFDVDSASTSIDIGVQVAVANNGAIFEWTDVEITTDHSPRMQTKTLGSNATTTGDITGLTFNSLVIGRAYKATLNYSFFINSAAVNEVTAWIRHNSVNEKVARYNPVGNSSNGQLAGSLVHEFIAEATTVTVNLTSANANNYLASGSKMHLKEIKVRETTTWT